MGAAEPMDRGMVSNPESAIPAALRHLTAVVMARLDGEGRLLDANLGFWRLIGREPLPAGSRLDIAECFVNPSLAALLGTASPPTPDAPLFAGLLTLGEPETQCRSISAVIHREGRDLLLIGEHDIHDLECVAAEVLQLNADLAEAQRGLVRKSNLLGQVARELEDDIAHRRAVEAELKQRFDELSALHAELKQTQAQLVQSEKLASIGQLAAGVAHEINNPIGFVQSNLGSLMEYFDQIGDVLEAYGEGEAMLREMSDPCPKRAAWLARMAATKKEAELDYLKEDIPALLQESRDGIARVKQIVADLKDFSRVDSAQQWETVDLRSGLDSTLNIVNNEIKYHADVVREYGDLPAIRCLPSQLNQVFMNLLVNAAQAMPESRRGTITIRCGTGDGGVWVEIADTGAGIPEENLNRIFDPFFTTKPIGKGTGLGLSLSYGIVKKHGGHIGVSSTVGAGTTFRISLPLEPPPSAEAAG